MRSEGDFDRAMGDIHYCADISTYRMLLPVT